jgi:hypothetical protein
MPMIKISIIKRIPIGSPGYVENVQHSEIYSVAYLIQNQADDSVVSYNFRMILS